MMGDLHAEITELIGRPWSVDYACWDLVRTVQRHFGRELPLVPGHLAADRRALVEAFERHPERENWRRVERPAHGAIVLMGRVAGRRDREVHSGVFLMIDGPGIIHTDKGHGVVLESVLHVRARGWAELNWYVPR